VVAEGQVFVGIKVFCNPFKISWRKDAET